MPTKTKRVLSLRGSGNAYMTYEDDDGPIALPVEHYEDMGRPDKIVVTIEPEA